MKVSIREIDPPQEEGIIIQCYAVNDEILSMVGRIKATSENLVGMDGDEFYRLQVNDIFYFEVVDNKSFLYGKEKVYESKLKLYEFEQLCQGTSFFRASKSVMLNSDRIEYIKPSFSGRFEATLENGEKVTVSRQYVPELKRIIGL